MSDTREKIIDEGRLVLQREGYNALSFRELGKTIGIKSASIHYHFPSKADLGAVIAREYAETAKKFLEGLLAKNISFEKAMREYVAAFRVAIAEENRLCLYSVMTAEREALPMSVRKEVNRFMDINIDYLTQLIRKQAPSKKLADAKQQATAIFAAIEGAQILALGCATPEHFDTVVDGYRKLGLFG